MSIQHLFSSLRHLTAGFLLAIAPSFASAASYEVVYSFQGSGDGSGPWAGLINVGGVLYGTTTRGGGTGCASFDYGCGTLFKITKKGAEKVLHVFGSGTDGIQPEATLLDVNGILYGTTADGGGPGCGGLGCGTVFKFDPATGTESVVHSFTAGADGEQPEAGLINFDGTLYGTTVFGGGTGCGGSGCGTVFAITQEGAESGCVFLQGFQRGRRR